MRFEFTAIGVVRTPYHDKFGIPRQPGLVASARGVVKLDDDPKMKAALRGIEAFSHVWIVFVFHRHGGKGEWKAAIRPPRLGGARRVGVLSSRSPHRPNPIGISAVRLESVDLDAAGGPQLHVSGVDLLDGTPVLDVKPYLPYADAIPDADPGWATADITRTPVTIAEGVDVPAAIRDLVTETIALDPRPASQRTRDPVAAAGSVGLTFGIDLLGFDVKYEIRAAAFRIVRITPLTAARDSQPSPNQTSDNATPKDIK